MKQWLLVPKAFLAICWSGNVFGQVISEAATVQQKTVSFADPIYAFRGNSQSARDLTISGRVEFTAGAKHETGTITFKAAPGGFSSSVMVLPSYTRSEIRTQKAGSIAGFLKDQNGSRSISNQNLLLAPYWFAPEFLIEAFDRDGSWAADRLDSYLTGATIRLHRQVPGLGPALARQSETDISLSPENHLPVMLQFREFAESPRISPLIIRIDYSDFRQVDGHQFPFSIRRYVNGTINLDIKVDKVQFDTGLQTSEFELK